MKYYNLDLVRRESEADPLDKQYEKLKTLSGVTHQGRGFYIIPQKTMTAARKKVFSDGRGRFKRTNRFELTDMGDLVGWGSGHPNVQDYRLKDWAEALK